MSRRRKSFRKRPTFKGVSKKSFKKAKLSKKYGNKRGGIRM